MIYELINNGSHGNNIALFKFEKFWGNFFMKCAFSDTSNRIIENEFKGYEWFFKKVLKKSCPVKIIKNNYYDLLIPEFKGKRFPTNSKIKKNENYIEILVDFYKKRWPKDEEFFVHGDLALCNLIINRDQINIVDWEHFHLSEKYNFGIDIFNMLFILLSYQEKRNGYISKKTKNFIRECYKRLFDGMTDNFIIIKQPFQYTFEYMKKYEDRYGMNKKIEDKFVITQYDKKELKSLDLAITKI